MADDADEMEEVVSIADALVINIGKLSKDQIAAMISASKVANKTKTPIILDPVGVGVSNLRNNTALEIINNYNISAIRGNITEIDDRSEERFSNYIINTYINTFCSIIFIYNSK